jgi:hypothetical protein
MNSPVRPTRTQWCQALLTEIDEAYCLDPAEQAQCFAFLHQILTALQIPERGAPQVLSSRLVVQMSCPQGNQGPLRRTPVASSWMKVRAETWAERLLADLQRSYPDISTDEAALVRRLFVDLFAAIGAPERPCTHVPQAPH